MVHNGEFTSVRWITIPGGCNHIPNAVLQALILTWVCWTGWWNAPSNIVDHVDLLGAVRLLNAGERLHEDARPVGDRLTTVDLLTGRVWQYSREDLVITGQLCQVARWLMAEEHTWKDVNARE